MAKENKSQEFRLKNIDETRNCAMEEINLNEMISKMNKNVCTNLNFIEHFLILATTITGCISISTLASLVGIPIRITTSEAGLKACAITAGIRNYKSIIKKKKKKHHKIVLLAKSKLNRIKVLTSKALIDSVISHGEFLFNK